MEPLLLCLIDSFLGPLKVLICDPSRDPSSWPPLYSQSQAHSLIRGCCPRKVDHSLKGTLFGPISFGQREQGSIDGQKVENGGV
jgi:hypothetical protein